MHRMLRELLDDASGHSEFVIALNIDVRGFSDFSLGVDSAQTALFVRKIYAKLIDKYFDKAAFLKPTGDGLFVIIAFDEPDLEAVLNKTASDCFEIAETFGSLCADEPMINFAVPDKVGIGIARGPASRLSSGDYVLDYSGRVLNLASRLMDVARPSGVVLDGDYGVDLLAPELRDRLTPDEIFLKGVSPNAPHAVYYDANYTEIPDIHKHPMHEVSWEEDTIETTLPVIASIGKYRLYLSKHPRDPSEIRWVASHPQAYGPSGRRHPSLVRFIDQRNVEFELEGGKPCVLIDYNDLEKRLRANRVKDAWPVKIRVIYPVPA